MPLFTRTQYGDCDQTRFLSSLGSHKFLIIEVQYDKTLTTYFERTTALFFLRNWLKHDFAQKLAKTRFARCFNTVLNTPARSILGVSFMILRD